MAEFSPFGRVLQVIMSIRVQIFTEMVHIGNLRPHTERCTSSKHCPASPVCSYTSHHHRINLYIDYQKNIYKGVSTYTRSTPVTGLLMSPRRKEALCTKSWTATAVYDTFFSTLCFLDAMCPVCVVSCFERWQLLWWELGNSGKFAEQAVLSKCADSQFIHKYSAEYLVIIEMGLSYTGI